MDSNTEASISSPVAPARPGCVCKGWTLSLCRVIALCPCRFRRGLACVAVVVERSLSRSGQAWIWRFPSHVLLAVTACVGEPSLPILGQVPAFTLIDHNELVLGSVQLEGQVWLANFIFTRCLGTCPQQTENLAVLQRRLRAHVARNRITLISFSVDPTYDTPAQLRRYANDRDVIGQPPFWFFLTGERDLIWELSKNGFKLGVGENPGDMQMPLFHSGRVVLVDQTGQIRGYYDGMDSTELDRLAQHAVHLAEANGGG